MSYYFFVGDTMLPVPPEKMNIKIKGKNKTVTLINEGEVNIIKQSGLTEITFDARLPNRRYPFSNYDTSLADSFLTSLNRGSSFNFKNASYFLSQLEKAKQNQKPLRLIICRMSGAFTMLFDTNMLVTLEDYGINEDARNGIDVVCPLKFKQYKPYGTKECEVTTDENGKKHIRVRETRPAVDKSIPAAMKIRNEQSIWEAVKGISNGSIDWKQVMTSNGISNPCAPMKRGTVLHLG